MRSADVGENVQCVKNDKSYIAYIFQIWEEKKDGGKTQLIYSTFTLLSWVKKMTSLH